MKALIVDDDRVLADVLAFTLRREGFQVIVAGEAGYVEALPLSRLVSTLGYQSAYLIAGPRMLDTMLRQQQLGRLFLTITHQILGGEQFSTLSVGARLGPAGYLRLHTLYYDAALPEGAGQWFAQFEPGPVSPTANGR